MGEDLGYAETLEMLERLGPIARDIVLVGGQAVNYWAEVYLPRSQQLQLDVPFTSKDLDFCGSARTAMACAAALGGRCNVPNLDDLTPCTGVVEYTDQFARSRTVDFLGAPFGLDARELREMAVSFEEPTASGVLELKVMHPVHMLESRANNVSGLPGYRTAHGLKQLRAAVECAREFSKDLLVADRTRDVLKLNERIFRFSLRDSGLDVWMRDGISVFDAVVRDPRLPEAFERVRYPQMKAELEQRRAHAADVTHRVDGSGVYVYRGSELRGSSLVAMLEGPNGSMKELPGYQPGQQAPRDGDFVRVGTGAQLDVVARGQGRGRGIER